MRKIGTVLIGVASAAALLTITACKELFADIEEDFSYWASEPVITNFRAASPVQTSAAGVQCAPSASDAVFTLTVRNPKNFTFIMPGTPGSPSDIVTFGSGIHDASGTKAPEAGVDYTLVQSGQNTLTLTYEPAFLKRYEQSRADIGASITLYSTDGRKFNQTYSFDLEANTPPPDPASVPASDDNHIALFKTAAADSQGKRYYVLCFKVAGFAEPGAPDLHSDLKSVYVSKNGGAETAYPVTLTTGHTDFDISDTSNTAFIAKTAVAELLPAEAAPLSGSPHPDTVPSGPWVLYLKTNVPVGEVPEKYGIRLFDGKLYSARAEQTIGKRTLPVPKVFAHADIDNVAAFGVYTEATKIVTPGSTATIDSNDLNGGGAPIGGVSPDGSDKTHAIPVYSAYGEDVKLTIKKPDGNDYFAGVTVTGSAEKHSGDSVSGTASFAEGRSAAVTLPSPADGGGEAVYKVSFKASGEGFDDSNERTLYYKVRREIKAVNNLPMWYMLGAAIEKIPLGGAGTVKISGTVKAENISYPPLPGTPPVSVVNDSTIDVSGEKAAGIYPGKTVTVIGDSKTSSILDASNLCSVFSIEFNGKLILKNVTLQNGEDSSGGYGGGIYIGDNDSSCEMTDTDIKNCTVPGGQGGAVYVKIDGSLTVGSGCAISGNTAPGGKGAAVYLASGGTFNISGNAKIDEGNDVYLAKSTDVPYDSSKNAKITVTAPLTGTHTVAKITPEDYTANRVIVNAASASVDISAYAKRFKISDQQNPSPPPSTVLWKLKYNGSALVLKPTTAITVDGSASNAWKTLKETIEAPTVEDGDEFVIKGTIKATKDPGNSGEITVRKKITVKGENTTAALDANSNHTGTPSSDAPLAPHRIFSVESGGELTLDGIRLQNGNAGSGDGGAILIKTGATADIRNTHIYGCKAKNGGAIHNGGTLGLSVCHIGSNTSANEATDDGGAICSVPTDPASCTIEGTDITYNKAGRSGGGICIVKGKCTVEPKDTTSTLIDHNVCSGSSAMGSGIYVGLAGSCTIKSLTKISNNGSAVCSGGGIYNAGTLEIEGNSSEKVEILNNDGKSGGGIYHNTGGTLTTEHTEIKNNSAAENGGGIYASGSCTLDEGTVIGGAGFDNTVPVAGSGGGVYVAGTFVMKSDARIVPPTTADAGKNDVYLMQDKYITLKDALTGTAPVARITPGRYIAGRAVMKGDGYTLTVSDTNRFTVTPDGGDEWGIKTDGTLVLNAVTVDGTGNAWKKLRQAVNNVADGGTIIIDGEIKATNAPGNYGEITISKNLTIKKADGATTAVINANRLDLWNANKSRIFLVNSGTLNLENLTLKDSEPASGVPGGGIFVNTGAGASLTDCRIGGCMSMLGDGGAVYTKGTLSLTRGSIGGPDQGGNGARYGGGIYVAGGSCTLTGTGISQNYADGDTLSSSEGKGGGIYVAQGGTCSLNDVDTMKYNGVSNGSLNKGAGAGIYVESGGTCNIAGGMKIDEANDVYLAKSTDVPYDSSKNAKITVTAPLTGTHTVAKITPEDYTAGVTAVNAASASVDISAYADRFKISDQQNPSPPPSTVLWKLKYNGSALVLNQATTFIPSTATWKTLKEAIEAPTVENGDEFVIKSTITATGAPGDHGAISVTKKITVKGGGFPTLNASSLSRVFTVENGGELTLENLMLKNGRATGTGEQGSGGAIFVRGGTVNITNCTLTSNTAAGTTDSSGGAIYASGATVTITNCTLTSNKAKSNGGAVHAVKNGSTGAHITISGGTIGGTGTDANTVTDPYGFGGGIYVNDGCTLTLNEYTDVFGGKHGIRIIGNEAGRAGGVRANNSTVTMENCTISGNTATDSTIFGGGGGVYTHGGMLTMTRCTLRGNTANNNGGGMIIEGGTAGMTNCTLTKNQAKNGGAIYAVKDSAGSDVTIEGGTIGGTGADANKATGTGANEGNGGGIYIGGDCTVTLQNNDQNEGCTVKGNTAKRGGGVYVDMNSTFKMYGGTIKNNTSDAGKGVYVAASSGGMGNQDGYFIMGGKACVGDWGSDGTLKDGNDVYLKENDDSGAPASIKIDKGNPITEPKVACITPESYVPGEIVVRMSDSSSVGAYTNKFTVTPQGGQTWSVDSDGTLKTP